MLDHFSLNARNPDRRTGFETRALEIDRADPFIVGRFADHMQAVRFGYPCAIVEGQRGGPAAVIVAEELAQILDFVSEHVV